VAELHRRWWFRAGLDTHAGTVAAGFFAVLAIVAVAAVPVCMVGGARFGICAFGGDPVVTPMQAEVAAEKEPAAIAIQEEPAAAELEPVGPQTAEPALASPPQGRDEVAAAGEAVIADTFELLASLPSSLGIGEALQVDGPAVLLGPRAATEAVVARPAASPAAKVAPPVATAAQPQAEVLWEVEVEPEVASLTDTGAVAVGGSMLNVRAGPGTSEVRLFVLPPGQQVEATHRQDGWVRIVAADGRSGWVDHRFLENLELEALAVAPDAEPALATIAEPAPDPERPAAPAATAEATRVVGASAVNVRSDPSNDGARAFVLDPGQEVTVNRTDKGWLYVTDAHGRSGWAYSSFFTPDI
jgi:uncharacterized protein YraI